MQTPGVVERLQGRKTLGKEPGLHLSGNFHFLAGTAFGFQFLRGGASLCFGRLGHFVEADQREGILIDIFEAGEYSSPNRWLLSQQISVEFSVPVRRALFILDAPQARNMPKADSAPAPLAISCHDIFGDKSNLRRLTDQFVLVRLGIRRNQGDDRGAVGRRDSNPTLSRLQAHIKGQTESKLIEIEPQTSILIANENVDRVDAEVGVVAIPRREHVTMAGYYKTRKTARLPGHAKTQFTMPVHPHCGSCLRVSIGCYCGGGAGVVVSPGVTWVPITHPTRSSPLGDSVCRPAAVLLSATGRVLPKPRAITLLIDTPLSTR